MNYTVTVPPTAQMGSYKTTVTSGRYETKAQQALWDYNNARAHDGLTPVSRMPAGTSYAPQVNARLIAAAPELLAALYTIQANAAESAEWIRRHTFEAIAKAQA